MRVVKDRGTQNLGLSNKVKKQYKDRENTKDDTLFSFSNIYDCYKYIKDNISGFADLFYSKKYEFSLPRTTKICREGIQIVCKTNLNMGIVITQDPYEENDRFYISSGINNERSMLKYMSKHCPDAVIENTGIWSVDKYYYGNTNDDCHSMPSILLDVVISYLKKVSSRKYPEHLRVPESMFSGVLESKQETNISNSQGQDVPEPGKHAENVYLPDCPFMIGKEQVDWFEYFQREKEKHTIKDVDDFIQSAKKETKLIKESCNKKVNALEWFVALKESSATEIARTKESKKGQSL